MICESYLQNKCSDVLFVQFYLILKVLTQTRKSHLHFSVSLFGSIIAIFVVLEQQAYSPF